MPTLTYDLGRRQMKGSLNVGFCPRRLFMSRSHIYVSNFEGGSVSVLLPGQISALKEIRVGGTPMETASSVNRRWLYVGNQGSQEVTVIDLTPRAVRDV
jgi:DNA-binding beta-propeller fold protein YncE